MTPQPETDLAPLRGVHNRRVELPANFFVIRPVQFLAIGALDLMRLGFHSAENRRRIDVHNSEHICTSHKPYVSRTMNRESTGIAVCQG